MWLRLIACVALTLTSDAFFLGWVARGYFKTLVQRVQQRELKLRWPAAIASSVGVAFGNWFFLLRDEEPWSVTRQLGAAVLAVLAYGTFEITCFAIFELWSVESVVLDLAYGITSVSSVYALTSQI